MCLIYKISPLLIATGESADKVIALLVKEAIVPIETNSVSCLTNNSALLKRVEFPML